MRDAASRPVTLRHTTGHFSSGHATNRSGGPTRGPANRPLPNHAERGAMEGRSRGPAGTSQRLSAIHAHLVQLEELVDRFRIAFAGRIQQPPALIQFFFFRMGCRSSFHRSRPFFCRPQYMQGILLKTLVIIYCGCGLTKDFELWQEDFLNFPALQSKVIISN